MPPSLALWLTLAIIAGLFIRDFRGKPNVTSALWLPFLWVVVGPGSRFLSQWLDILGFHVGGVTVEDGSPIDAAFYFALIAAGLLVLRKRRVVLAQFVRHNRWLAIYLLFCLIAISWSDFPYVSFKRWIKLLGDPVMALIVLTEANPTESLAVLGKRCAYFMLPVSILFIKYFPDLGRYFDPWSGAPMNTGISTNKNELGFDCWILGMILFWHLLHVLKWERSKAKWNELGLGAGLLAMDVWLLKMAQSMSSLVAFALGSAIILFFGFRWVQARRAGAYIVAGIAICALAGTIGFMGDFIHFLGRNETLTGRTDIWRMLWNWDINPIIGTGYESFWLGERREEIQSVQPALNEAHNGYLETYLNLGFIGVGITVAMLFAAYAKSRRELFHNFEFGRFRLAYLISFILYNWTEAAFRLNGFPFFIFFLIAMDYRVAADHVPERVPEAAFKRPTLGFIPADN